MGFAELRSRLSSGITRVGVALVVAALVSAAPSSSTRVVAAPGFVECLVDEGVPGAVLFSASDPGWLDGEGYRLEGAVMTWSITGPGMSEVLYGPDVMGEIQGMVWGLTDGETYTFTYEEYVSGESNFELVTCSVTASGESTESVGWSVSAVSDPYARPDDAPPDPGGVAYCDAYPWLCEEDSWSNPTEMRIAVIRLNFRGDRRIPGTARDVGDKFFNQPDTDGVDRSLARFIRDASYGRYSVTGEVFPVMEINSNRNGCDFYTSLTPPYTPGFQKWGQLARQKLVDTGVDLSDFTHVVYVWPTTSCGFGGRGAMPGSTSWINIGPRGWAGTQLRETNDALSVVMHEIGHNLGLGHAGAVRCSLGGKRVSLGGTCARGSLASTGHPYALMGYPSLNQLLTTYERYLAGFLIDGEFPQLQGSGTYEVTLNPVEYPDSVVKGVRIVRQVANPREYRKAVRPSNGGELCLEWHRPYNMFNTMKGSARIMQGVLIHVCDVRPLLVDANPKSLTYADAALAVGQSLVDQFSDIRITVLSKNIDLLNPARSEINVRVEIP